MTIRAASLLFCFALLGSPNTFAQTNDNYPTQGRAGFTLTATVSSVDADRDRVIVLSDDGRRYTIDTYKCEIGLRAANRSGETGDLVRGMRVSITGRLLSSSIVAADRLRVLALNDGGGRQTMPSEPREDGRRIELRGTVTSVEERRKRFVVRVNSRQRTIFVNDDTEFRNIETDGAARVPVRSGDRVTVAGQLHADGSVDADILTLGTPPPSENSPFDSRFLVGRISGTSDRYLSRDIKIRLENSDREVKIFVPKNTAIRRDGRAISVHELSKNDIVRISGTRDGDNFRASRIDVLSTQGNDLRDEL